MSLSLFQPRIALRRAGRRRGFSLVELMVTAGIIVITVGGFYATFGAANDFAVRARLNNSAKVLLGAAMNEALGGRWTSASATPAQKLTGGWEVYSTQNEGKNAKPAPRGPAPDYGDGIVHFFTTAGETGVVVGRLERWCFQHPTRSDVRIIRFRVKYNYKGADSGWLYAQTAISRVD